MKFFAFFVALFAQAAIGQVLLDKDSCPNVCKQENLVITPELLGGYWFQQSGTPFSFDPARRCTNSRLTYLGGDLYRIERSTFDFDANAINETTFSVLIGSDGVASSNITNIGVLKTQIAYLTEDLLVSITCYECGFYGKEGAGTYVSVFTRVPFPTCEVTDQANEHLTACGIPISAIPPVDQSDCKVCLAQPSA